MTAYQVERYADVVEELKPIYLIHHEEITEHSEVTPFGPNYESYTAMNEAGAMVLITARNDGLLIGYMQVFVVPHLHHVSVLTAMTDLFFIMKEHRKGYAGINLLKFTIEEMRRRKVGQIYSSCKLNNDIGHVLERAGFEPIERNYMMVL